MRPLLNVVSRCDTISHGLIMFEVPYLEDKIEFVSGSDLFYLCNSINHPVKCFSVSCSPSEIFPKHFHSLHHEIFIEAPNPNYVIKLFSISSLEELTSKLDYSVQHLNYICTDCAVVNHPLTMCFVLPSPTEKHHLTMEVTTFYIYKSFFQQYQPVKIFGVPFISSEKYALYCCSQENSYNRTKSFSVPIYSQRNLTRIKNQLRIKRSHFCASCTITDHHFLDYKSSHQNETSILKYTSDESLLENNIIKIARSTPKAFDNRNFPQSIILTNNFIENKLFSNPITRRKEFLENNNRCVKTIGTNSIFDLQRIHSPYEIILGVNDHEIQSMTYPHVFLSRDANRQETLSEIFKQNTDVSKVLNLTSNLIGKTKYPSDSEENDLLQSLIRNSAICGNISKATNYSVPSSECESPRKEPKLLFNLNEWSQSVYVSSFLSRRDGLCFELLDSVNLNFNELFKHKLDMQKNNLDSFNSVLFEVQTESKTKYPNSSRSKQKSEKQYGNIDSGQLLFTFAERLKINSTEGNDYLYSLDVLKDFVLTLYFTSPGSYDRVIQKFIQETNRENISETIVYKNLDSIFNNFCSIKNKYKCKEYNIRDILKSCNHQTKWRIFTKSWKNWTRRQNSPILNERKIIHGNGNSSEQEEKFDVKIKYFENFNERKISRSKKERIHIGRNIKSENWNDNNTITEDVNSKTSVEKTFAKFHGMDFTDEDIILKLYMRDYYERIYKLYKYYSRKAKNENIIKHSPTLFSKQNVKKVQYNFDKLLYGFRNTSQILDEITSHAYLNDCELKRERITFERDVNKLGIVNKVDSITDERIRHLKENILRYYNRECCKKLERNSKRVLTNSDRNSKKTNERTRHTNAYNTFHRRFTEEKKNWEEYKSAGPRRNKNTHDKYFLTHYQWSNLHSDKISEDVILKLYLKDYINVYERNNLSFKRKLSGKEINDSQTLIRYKPETSSDISMQSTDIKSSGQLQDLIFSKISINRLRNIEEENDAFDAILKFYMIDYYERLNKRSKWKRLIDNSSNSLFKSNLGYYKNKIESKELCQLKKIRNDNKNYNFCYNKELSEFVVPTNLWKDDIILKYYFLSPFPFIDGTNKTRLNKAITEDNKVVKIQTAASHDNKKYENNPIKMSFTDENVYKNKTIYERILETFKTLSKHRTTRMRPKEFTFKEEFIIKTESEVEVKRSKVFQRREVNTDEDVAIIISSQKIQYFPKVLDKLTTISAIPKEGFDVRKQMTVPLLTQNGNAVVDLKNKKKKVTDVNRNVSKSQFEMNFTNTKFNRTERKKAFYTYETSL
ncbi:repetitive organellar protein-like [Centruroides vittatus]|uniref:repetitive organellar protein-like n=1 Tax=Centruroides vittatus TaxID=120091 RepID=UPI00350EA527